MSAALKRVADLVEADSGIELRGARIASLTAAVAKVMPGSDAHAALAALHDPDGGAALRARLCEAVAVHETFFLRHRDDLEAIDWRALLTAARAAGSDRVRVWVAGCSTGEEAYTLAILASEAFGMHDPPVSILATDLSSAAIGKAELGEYGTRSMRNVSEAQRERHFTAERRRHRVGERLRALVSFQQHNLLSAPPAGSFELILCRNVLIYFQGGTVERVLGNLESALAPGGALVLGAADRLCRPVAARPKRERRPQPAEPSRRDWRELPAPETVDRAPAARLEQAVAAADAGRLDEAIEATREILAADPLDADAHFIRGVVQLGRGDAAAAAESLRRALYIDSAFALAAFKLGRAHDALGDELAALRAYRQALETLAPGHDRQERLATNIDLADVAAACSARVASLRAAR